MKILVLENYPVPKIPQGGTPVVSVRRLSKFMEKYGSQGSEFSSIVLGRHPSSIYAAVYLSLTKYKGRIWVTTWDVDMAEEIRRILPQSIYVPHTSTVYVAIYKEVKR